MKNQKTFWTNKTQIQFLKPNKSPIRINKLRLKNPYGDYDKDRVMNWFDCKPRNRFRQDEIFEGSEYVDEPNKAVEEQNENFALADEGIPIQPATEELQPIERELPTKPMTYREGPTTTEELGEGMQELLERKNVAVPGSEAERVQQEEEAEKEVKGLRSKLKRAMAFTSFREKAKAVSGKKLGKLREQLEKRQPIISEKKYKRNVRSVAAGMQLLTGQKMPGAYNPKQYFQKNPNKQFVVRNKIGRPRGASGKYYIPGVGPMGVYEWRKYNALQKRQARLAGARAQFSAQRFPSQYSQQQPMYPQQEYQQQPRQMQQAPLRPIGNILNAPNIMKGEMMNTQNNPDKLVLGWPKSDVGNVENISRPVSNPYGDEYLETDPLTGRPVLRRRAREKWLSGERRF